MRRCFIVSLVFLLSTTGYAVEQSLLIEATGEARLGETETPKEVKERAKRDALNKALEMAVGSFIKSHTLVSNNQLAEDLVFASVRGKVEKAEILGEDWDEKDRNLYRVRLKALVSPLYPEKGEGLSLKVSLSKSVVKEGEEVEIFYQANRDCYVYIFSVAVDGSVTLLLPNARQQDNFTAADKACEFPSGKNPLRLQARFLPYFKGNVAEERIKVIVTKKKEDIISLGFREGMFQVYDAKSTGMISDLVRRLNQLEPTEWTEAAAAYRIER